MRASKFTDAQKAGQQLDLSPLPARLPSICADGDGRRQLSMLAARGFRWRAAPIK
jgi:hypothetical protein